MKISRLFFLLTLIVQGSISAIPAEDKPEWTADPQQELSNWLDERFEARWKENHVPIPAIVDDARFLRRIFLDLGGTIPSVSQTRDFLTDEATNKRERIVDRLLSDPRSPKHLARVWRRMMVPGNGPESARALQLFEPWLVEQFAANTHYNELTRQVLVSAPASSMMQPVALGMAPVITPSASGYLDSVGRTPDAIAGASTRFFLGVSLNCAKCHDHPFAQWKQRDFWGMAAFFANPAEGGGMVRSEKGDLYAAVYLGGENATIPAGKSPTEVLVEWMTSRENTNFGATAVNRVWQHLYGRGAVSEIDDLDRAPTEERAFFLDEMGRKFAAADYDLRWLMAGLCKSRTYQRESPSKSEGTDSLTQRPLKTLLPEQVFDSLEQALNLPIGKSDDSPRTNGTRNQMVAKLNEAATNHPDQFRSGIPQALMLMHGSMVSNATDLETSRTLRAVIEAPFFEPTQRIETLYMATLTRKPRAQELRMMLEFVQEQPEQKQAYAEIMWALLNSPEFVLSP